MPHLLPDFPLGLAVTVQELSNELFASQSSKLSLPTAECLAVPALQHGDPRVDGSTVLRVVPVAPELGEEPDKHGPVADRLPGQVVLL